MLTPQNLRFILFCAEMTSSSGPERIKTTVANTEKGKKRKQKVHNHHFLSKKHEENFEVVQNCQLLMKRRVEQLLLEAHEFTDELIRRHWTRLLTFPALANITMVREFYANARIFSDEEESFMSYIRGKRVPNILVSML